MESKNDGDVKTIEPKKDDGLNTGKINTLITNTENKRLTHFLNSKNQRERNRNVWCPN